MIYIGIDPGLHGAIATISDKQILLQVIPTISDKKNKRTLEHKSLTILIGKFIGHECYAVLEEQHAMPKQGVVSTLTIGYVFGALKQCLVDSGTAHEVVRASTWQKEFGISSRKGNTKAQALQICQDLFPGVSLLATERSQKPHDGFADALLIAEFARRRHGGNTAK
jgi:hypothetical protein